MAMSTGRLSGGAYRSFWALVVLIVVAAMAVPAFAQITTARLSGTVQDSTGSAVTGASITITDVGTGYTQTAKSNTSGGYLFPSLPVGTYRMTVAMGGFAPYEQKGIALSVGQAATVLVRLQLGAISQQVTVTANASLVTTDSPTVGQVIPEKDIAGLPYGRSVQQLVFLAPGASNVTSNYCAEGCEGGVFPGEQYAKINGGGANGTNYQLDGVAYNDTYLNTNLPFPNPDAIEEFNLITGNMSAAYGNAIGGIVNVVTKSGTNQVHGDVFEFLQNSALNARDYFADNVSPLKQNQFGGSVGGPLMRNKLFYFGTYQGTRISTANNGEIVFVPNADERKGDFSDLLPDTQLVDPFSGNPFPNNQLPVSPVASYILKHIPLPNGPNDQLTFNGAPEKRNTNEYMVKLDLNTAKHHLSGHYFQMDYTNPVVHPADDNLLQLRGNAEHLVLKNVSVVDIYTIASNFLLGSYFGDTMQDGTTLSSAPFSMADAGSQIAVPQNRGGGQGPVLNVTVGGLFGLPAIPYGTWDRGDISLREVATLTKGNHEIQFGGQVTRISLPMGNEYQESGVYDFSNALSGSSLADFVYGAVSSFTQGGGLYLNFTGYRWSLFMQDNWKATPRLTLSAGLRWDPFFPYKESHGRVGCFVPGAQSVRFPNAPEGLIFGGKNHDPGCPESSIYSNPKNFGPRVGFAYQLTEDGKTSIRGGAGYYYESPNTVAFEDVVGIPPFAPIINLNTVSFADPYGSAGTVSPFPNQFGPVYPGPDATFPTGISFSQIFDRHFRLPMVLAYNLTFERGIGANWLVRASYVGNSGRHLNGTGDQEAGLLELNPNDPATGQRIYPQYGSIGQINSGVNSAYNAGQISLSKRFVHGLSLLTNFTWARGLDDYAPIGNPNLTNTCSCGRAFDWGPSDDDLNKVFKINGDYQLPRANVPQFAGKVINGWEVTAIASWHTGAPFTIFSGFDNSNSLMGSDRADLAVPHVKDAVLGAGRSHAEQVAEWFKTTAFVPNAAGTFGDTGKNILRGPRYFDTDLAAVKNTKIGDRVGVEFRAELYNAFNNVNFTKPDNIVADPGFGQITGDVGPRTVQFGLKASF